MLWHPNNSSRASVAACHNRDLSLEIQRMWRSFRIPSNDLTGHFSTRQMDNGFSLPLSRYYRSQTQAVPINLWAPARRLLQHRLFFAFRGFCFLLVPWRVPCLVLPVPVFPQGAMSVPQEKLRLFRLREDLGWVLCVYIGVPTCVCLCVWSVCLCISSVCARVWGQA